MLSIKQIWKYLLAIVLTLTVALAAAGCGGGAAASSSAASKAKSSAAKSGKALTVRMLDIGQGDACLLEKDGKFVGPSGDGNAHGLGEDDAPDGLQIAHSQSPCSLKLSGRN